MNYKDLILIDEFCLHHGIEVTFITALQNYGIIEIIIVEEKQYISPEHLAAIEKMIRLHYDLEINFEGIDAIAHLLNRIETLQHELVTAQNRLRLFDKL